MPDLTSEELAALKAEDARLREVELGFAVAAELRDSAAVKALVEGLRREAYDAVLALADASPSDLPAISNLVATARAFAIVRRRLQSVMTGAKLAEGQILAEDRIAGLDERDG